MAFPHDSTQYSYSSSTPQLQPLISQKTHLDSALGVVPIISPCTYIQCTCPHAKFITVHYISFLTHIPPLDSKFPGEGRACQPLNLLHNLDLVELLKVSKLRAYSCFLFFPCFTLQWALHVSPRKESLITSLVLTFYDSMIQSAIHILFYRCAS